MPVVSTLCGARWILLMMSSWPLGVLVSAFPGGSLVQADGSHCPCLALGTVTDAQHSRAPHLVGGASGVQRLVCLQYAARMSLL